MYGSIAQQLRRLPFGTSLLRLFVGLDRSELRRTVFDHAFRHPIGLKAGIDPEGRFYNEHLCAGFSFATIGPISDGPALRKALNHLQEDLPTGPVLMDITKRPASVTEEDISRDYLSAFASAYDFADIFVLDLASRGVGAVLEASFIQSVTDPVLDTRLSYDNFRPVVLRLHPDLPRQELERILDYSRMNGVDGVAVQGLDTVRNVFQLTQGRFPIIASARLRRSEEAAALLEAGASLVELDCKGPEIKGIMRGRKIIKNLIIPA